jgi:hypothetical protein
VLEVDRRNLRIKDLSCLLCDEAEEQRCVAG